LFCLLIVLILELDYLSGTFSADSGTSLPSVYGWSKNLLVEHYIIEDNFNAPSFGAVKGPVYSDGSEYIIYESTRIIYENGPIISSATLNQYFSVRDSPRQSSTITVENHFQAWADLGLRLGSLNYQIVAVEGWGGEGVVTQSVSN
jgi:endo-1,4-beta-xylanase